MSDDRRLSLDRPPSSSTENWGPFHSVIMEDIEHIYGFRGQLVAFTKFTGIDLINGGYDYDPADPPTVAVRFGGRDYGVRAIAHVSDWTGHPGTITSIEITDMGLHGSHDPAYPVLQLHVKVWGTDNQGARFVQEIEIDHPGGGYTAPPIISFSEYLGSHTDAILQATLAPDGSVAGVEIVYAGAYNRNMANPPPLPTPLVSDPPTQYDVYPDILIVDANDNQSAIAWPTAGGHVVMDDPNHHVEVYDTDGRLVFRDGNEDVYEVPGIEITGVTGQDVYFTMHLQDDPYSYNLPAGDLQASSRPPPPSASATRTAPCACRSPTRARSTPPCRPSRSPLPAAPAGPP